MQIVRYSIGDARSARTLCSFLRLITFVSITTLLMGTGFRQQLLPAPPSVSQTATDMQDMAKKVAEAAARWHRSILIDGEPGPPSGPIPMQGTDSQSLNSLANAFDYDWKRVGDIVCMTKRFQSDATLPQFHLSELKLMASNAIAAFGEVPLVGGPHDHHLLFNRFYESLSPDMTSALKAGEVLHGDRLNGDQLNLLSAYLFNGTFMPAYANWDSLAAAYSGFRKSRIRLRRLSGGSRLPSDPAETQYVLEWILTDAKGLVRIQRVHVDAIAAGAEAPGRESHFAGSSLPRETESLIPSQAAANGRPAEEIRNALEVRIHNIRGSMTVAELLKRISVQSGIYVRAGSGLNDRVLIVDLDGVSSMAVLNALCSLGNWNWNVDNLGAHVAWPFKRPTGIAAMISSISKVEPMDIQHYIGETTDPSSPDFRPSAEALRAHVQDLKARQKAGGKLQQQIDADTAVLWNHLSSIASSEEIKVADLSTDDQQVLLRWATLQGLNEVNKRAISHNVYGAYLLDTSESVLRLNGTMLRIGSTTVRNDLHTYVGGGEEIDAKYR